MKQVPDYYAGAGGGSALQNNGWCQQNQLEPHLLLYVRSTAMLLLFFFSKNISRHTSDMAVLMPLLSTRKRQVGTRLIYSSTIIS